MQRLEERYPWPHKKPPWKFDPHGWLANSTAQVLAEQVSTHTELIVECGSWLGLSSRYLLSQAPNAKLICIDHWKGSFEHYESEECRKRLPSLYERFCANCWQYRNRIVPMKTSIQEGLDEIASYSLRPDLIYLDASHDKTSVQRDLSLCLKLFPNTRVVGDDWWWKSVQTAVRELTEQKGLPLQTKGNAWLVALRTNLKTQALQT